MQVLENNARNIGKMQEYVGKQVRYELVYVAMFVCRQRMENECLKPYIEI